MSIKMVHSGEIHGIVFIKPFRLPNQICHGEAYTSRTLLFYHFSLLAADCCFHQMDYPWRMGASFSSRLILIKRSSKCLAVNIFSIVFLVYSVCRKFMYYSYSLIIYFPQQESEAYSLEAIKSINCINYNFCFFFICFIRFESLNYWYLVPKNDFKNQHVKK